MALGQEIILFPKGHLRAENDIDAFNDVKSDLRLFGAFSLLRQRCGPAGQL